MWQEARKQEKKLRCIMIDYKKRAERRQAYYARMRMDPHQLMRVYGQKCKFHIFTGGDGSKSNNVDGQLMPWQGDPEVMIDRFDVRAHLDYIPETPDSSNGKEMSAEEEKFLRKCSYERYRTLVQIDATGASEEQYLKQLEVEEGIGRSEMEKKRMLENDKNASKAKAKFHYKYDDSTENLNDNDESDEDSNSDEESDGELSDIDINVNVLDLSEEQTNHLDALATQYGVGYGQYCKQLLLEKKEFEYVKKLEEEEEERAKMPGRKGKSARRCLRAKQKTLRGSPLSFALHEGSPNEEDESHNKMEDSGSDSDSSSHSKTPVDSKVEFITSFGGDESNDNNGPELPTMDTTVKKKSSSDRRSSHKQSKRKSKSRSRSRSPDRSSRSEHRSRDKHRSRSRSRDRHRSHHSSSRSHEHGRSSHTRHNTYKSRNDSHNDSYSNSNRSRSRSPRNSRSNRSRSRSPHRDRSRGHDRSKDRSKRRSRSRSNSRGKEDTRKRSRSRSRSSSCSKSRDNDKSKSPHKTIVKRLGTDTTPNPTVDKSALTPREKMKLRMQKLLNRQIKSDKKEEHKKQVAKEQEIEERDMEIYEMSRMLRMKEREKRGYRSPSPKGHMPSYDVSRVK